MNVYDDSMASRFGDRLRRRERQLRALLQVPGEAGPGGEHDVEDFKDMASRESLAAVDEVHAGHAARELQEVVGALARLDSHRYGLCVRCDAAIDLLRLEALPATPMCIACQTSDEQERAPGPRR